MHGLGLPYCVCSGGGVQPREVIQTVDEGVADALDHVSHFLLTRRVEVVSDKLCPDHIAHYAMCVDEIHTLSKETL